MNSIGAKMPDISFNVGNFQVVTARIEPSDITGIGSPAAPRLSLPFKVQLLPAGPQQQTASSYVLLRFAGRLHSPRIGELANFEAGPIAQESNPAPNFFRQILINVEMDSPRVRQFEDVRGGGDAQLDIDLSGLIYLPLTQKFQILQPGRPLQISVPRSHWVDRVVHPWDLDSVKLIEIRFLKSKAGDTFRDAYARVEAAEKHYANGQYKEVLTSLRLSFERLANDLGNGGRFKECLESVLSDYGPEKRQKAIEALNGFYRFLHLGPHEQPAQSGLGDQPSILRQDARFALTMAHAIFEYITPRG